MVEILDSAAHQAAAGGPVMAPILAASVWMWVLIFRKGAELRRMSREMVRGGFRAAPGVRPRDPETARGLAARFEERAMRHVDTVLTLAAICPLLGLLGTVTGMIGAFDVIREFGTGDARGLASNISQALITTQFGLVAGVPGLVMGHFLRRRAEALAGLAERLHLVQACGEPRGEEAA